MRISIEMRQALASEGSISKPTASIAFLWQRTNPVFFTTGCFLHRCLASSQCSVLSSIQKPLQHHGQVGSRASLDKSTEGYDQGCDQKFSATASRPSQLHRPASHIAVSRPVSQVSVHSLVGAAQPSRPSSPVHASTYQPCQG
jgi:hypothetical protein